VQGESTETAGGALEELAAGERVHGVVEGWSFERRKNGENLRIDQVSA
jgi:hypothetical protein